MKVLMFALILLGVSSNAISGANLDDEFDCYSSVALLDGMLMGSHEPFSKVSSLVDPTYDPNKKDLPKNVLLAIPSLRNSKRGFYAYTRDYIRYYDCSNDVDVVYITMPSHYMIPVRCDENKNMVHPGDFYDEKVNPFNEVVNPLILKKVAKNHSLGIDMINDESRRLLHHELKNEISHALEYYQRAKILNPKEDIDVAKFRSALEKCLKVEEVKEVTLLELDKFLNLKNNDEFVHKKNETKASSKNK